MALTCKKHSRRVMTIDGKVLHRSDGSHCDPRGELTIHGLVVKAVKAGLMLVPIGKGKLYETPKSRRGYHYNDRQES